MAIIDKVTVGGTTYNIQDTNSEKKISIMNEALLRDANEQFSYSVGTKLDKVAPYMGTEKYGFKTTVTLARLSFDFIIALGKDCNVTYSIKDSSNNVIGDPITKSYTSITAGDEKAVSLTYEFDNGLNAGQYYLWINSSANNSLSYGYSPSTFPTFKYIVLTNDGGWSGNANETNLSAYTMLLNAQISGETFKVAPNIDSNGIYIKNESCKDTLYLGYLWTESNGVISVNYNAGGNTWFYYQLDKRKLKTNIVRVSADVTLGSGSELKKYIFGYDSSGSSLYIAMDDIVSSGHVEFDVDLNYNAVYKNLDMSRPVSIGFATRTSPCVATIENFEIIAINISIEADNIFDAISQMDTQIKSNSNSIAYMSGAMGIYKAPNGDSYFLTVANDGTVSAIKTIPNKVLFVGNSLLTGNGLFGMNATDQTKDYYMFVRDTITSLNPNATFARLGGTGFEGCETLAAARTWMSGTLAGDLASDLDLVVVQLGDNVNTPAKVSVFADSCGELISYIRQNAPGARVAWVGEWYSTQQKQQIISNACIAYGAVFIDISGLNTTENKSYIGAVINKASSSTTTYVVDGYTDDATNHVLTVTLTIDGNSYTVDLPYTSYTANGDNLSVTGTYTITTNSGVASHPGDAGMSAVGNAIVNALGLA